MSSAPAAEVVAKRRHAEQRFAAGQRHRQRARQARVAGQVVGADRFFEPDQVVLAERLAEGQRGALRAAAFVEVDHQRKVRADALAHARQQLRIGLRRHAHAQLHRAVAGAQVAVDVGVEVAVRVRAGFEERPADIGRHAVTQCAAEQRRDRHACAAGCRVPDRDVDRAHRHVRDAAPVVAERAHHRLPHAARRGAVLAEHGLAEAVADRCCCSGRHGPGLAPADGAVGRGDRHQQGAALVEEAARVADDFGQLAAQLVAVDAHDARRRVHDHGAAMLGSAMVYCPIPITR